MRRRAGPLETLWVEVPEAALEPYEAAMATCCTTVGLFLADEDARIWRVEGVRDVTDALPDGAMALAALVTGVTAALHRAATEAEGWVLRTQAAFPEQLVGRRYAIRGSHDHSPAAPGRITLVLDAGLAFGSGEHGSTRGCLRALEHVARRRSIGSAQCRMLDMGTGSGVLAIAAARLLRRPVLATDIEPWSVRVAVNNARDNGVGHLVRPLLAKGWQNPVVRRSGPYGLVLANILARPLCLMARDLARHMMPGGRVILAGLLDTQRAMVLAAHRRHGLVHVATYREGPWVTLVLRYA